MLEGINVAELTSIIDPTMLIWRILGACVALIAFIASLSLVIPSIVDRLMPPPRQRDLWEFLPFESVHADRKTVICKPNRYLRVIMLKGTEITLSSDQTRDHLFNARKHFFDEIEKYGIEQIKIFQIKERVELKRTLRPAQPLLRTISDNWEASFPSPYMTRHYVVIVAKAKSYTEACAALDPSEVFTVSSLAEYGPKVLKEPDPISLRPGDRYDDELPPGPLKALANVISPISKPSPYGVGWASNLSALITGDDVDFSRASKGTIIFRHGEETRYAAILTWRHCGEKTAESIMRDVLGVDAEMIIYHAIKPIQTAMAILDLNRGRRASVAEHLSTNAAEAYDHVLRQVEGQVAEERASLAYYAIHIMVMAKTERELKEHEKRLTAVMTRTSGTVVRIGASAQPTLLSTVTFDDIWPRQFRFLSSNIAANTYFQKSETGMIKSDWCNEPIAWLKTVGGDPYPFHWHAHSGRNAPAHTLVIGPTGAGKTSLLTFLAGSSLRVPNLRVYLLDRMQGMKNFCTCSKGRYISFDGEAKNSALNPLHLPDTPENRKFLHRWMRLLANTDIDDAASDDEIARAISLIYDSNQPKQNRSLKLIARAAFSATGSVRRNMQSWTQDNVFGSYFNAPEDTLDFSNDSVIAFNMTDILLDEKLAPAITDYLIHRIRQLSITTTYPSLIIVDETKPMLSSSKVFAQNFVATGLMEGRKLGQAYVLCFQTPGALFSTGMEQVIMDQCQVQIFFRNPRDAEETADQYRQFGLNESEIDFVTGRTFRDRRYSVLIKKPMTNEAAIVDVDLSRLNQYMGVFESDARQVAALEELTKRHPTDEAIKLYLESHMRG